MYNNEKVYKSYLLQPGSKLLIYLKRIRELRALPEETNDSIRTIGNFRHLVQVEIDYVKQEMLNSHKQPKPFYNNMGWVMKEMQDALNDALQ